ncbi:hypothetical protein P8C59_004875 [Phyllachora maydis]|uniref:Uncharacterized protein n=1 Tax=Phyllachora maydis TaxID=1825666 RepID=A0AAD9I4H4_9PEZI|nr:hypothetical protein P8C59_004875 [Phyllachora maydis]
MDRQVEHHGPFTLYIMSDSDEVEVQEPVLAEDDPMRAFLPTAEGDDDDRDDSDESDDEDEFPVSHELVLKTHERAVTTVAVDLAGGRLVSGSLDGTIKLHDFASMTPTTLRAFKTVDPWESKKASANTDSHFIHHLEFSPRSGGVLLVTCICVICTTPKVTLARSTQAPGILRI